MKKFDNWMDAIQEFLPKSEEYRKLSLGASLLTFMTGDYHRVENTWEDYGANLRWTTILKCDSSEKNPQFRWSQALTPKQQVDLLEAETAREILDAVEIILKEQEAFRDECFPACD